MDAKESLPVPEGFRTLKNGPPAEDWVGPFYYKKSDEGLTLGFRAEQRHANIIGSVHGGVMQLLAAWVQIRRSSVLI